MSKITNAVLAERISAMHDDIRDIKPDVKANTMFRQKASGAITIIALGSTFVGGMIVQFINKIWK